MDVIFEPPRGRPFSIEVGYFDTVLEIKEKIQKYQAIPISNQTLIFNGNVLQDNRDVEHCDILQSSHIQLIISPEFDKAAVEIESLSLLKNSKVQLNIKTPTSKFHAPLEMDINNTIGQLKEKTQKMEDLPINRLMIHSSGTELQDHRSLRDYDLSDNSNLDVSFKGSPTNSTAARPGPTMAGSKKLKLMVLAKCGTKKIPIEVNASDNVGELRKELQKLQQRLHFHLPHEGYFFIYEQNVMDDDRSFRWHHVGQGDTIEIFNGSVTGGS
ncbi:ubiquitin domain-containing protein 7SL RNA2-like [Corylus avellana]|uniref:ubiquitin domain-containing protein 7SL RNA2-like n=1 Tax=Corylus avellana TaxID=13451 RepID=UPI001E203CDD|nr:ubiquitin domain-containing protein 7SL RNA2-like [Corylus avellana]